MARDRQGRDRLLAHRFGLSAETRAHVFLMCKGYRILAKRYSAPGGEVDLVARRGDTICFVEVKARPTLEEARASITEQKRRRISRAAAGWLTRNGWAAGMNLRGDAVFIAPRRWPVHVAEAFGLDLG